MNNIELLKFYRKSLADSPESLKILAYIYLDTFSDEVQLSKRLPEYGVEQIRTFLLDLYKANLVKPTEDGKWRISNIAKHILSKIEIDKEIAKTLTDELIDNQLDAEFFQYIISTINNLDSVDNIDKLISKLKIVLLFQSAWKEERSEDELNAITKNIVYTVYLSELSGTGEPFRHYECEQLIDNYLHDFTDSDLDVSRIYFFNKCKKALEIKRDSDEMIFKTNAKSIDSSLYTQLRFFHFMFFDKVDPIIKRAYSLNIDKDGYSEKLAKSVLEAEPKIIKPIKKNSKALLGATVAAHIGAVVGAVVGAPVGSVIGLGVAASILSKVMSEKIDNDETSNNNSLTTRIIKFLDE